MVNRPLFDRPPAVKAKPRQRSKTPVLPPAVKTPHERWLIEFSGRDDETPLICRMRRMLKSAGRAYRLKARIVAQPTPDSTPELLTTPKAARIVSRPGNGRLRKPKGKGVTRQATTLTRDTSGGFNRDEN